MGRQWVSDDVRLNARAMGFIVFSIKSDFQTVSSLWLLLSHGVISTAKDSRVVQDTTGQWPEETALIHWKYA